MDDPDAPSFMRLGFDNVLRVIAPDLRNVQRCDLIRLLREVTAVLEAQELREGIPPARLPTNHPGIKPIRWEIYDALYQAAMGQQSLSARDDGAVLATRWELGLAPWYPWERLQPRREYLLQTMTEESWHSVVHSFAVGSQLRELKPKGDRTKGNAARRTLLEHLRHMGLAGHMAKEGSVRQDIHDWREARRAASPVGPDEYARLLDLARQRWPKVKIRDATAEEMQFGTIAVAEEDGATHYLHTAEHFREWFEARRKGK